MKNLIFISIILLTSCMADNGPETTEEENLVCVQEGDTLNCHVEEDE